MHKKLLNKDFVLLCLGYALTTFGTVLYSAAESYWVYEKTGSTSLLGAVTSLSSGIQLVMGPVLGAIADHLRSKRVTALTDVVRGAVFLLLGFLAMGDRLSVWMIFVTGAMSGIFTTLSSPSSTSLAVDLLDESVMIKGQSVWNSLSAAASLAGNALSGLLIVKAGVPVMITVNGILCILAGAGEWLIHDFPAHNSGKTFSEGGLLTDLKESVIYLAGSRGMFKLCCATVLGNLFSAGFYNLMVPYTSQSGMTTEQFGYLRAFIKAGSLIGTLSLTVIRLEGRKAVKTVAWSFVLSALAGAAGIYIASFKVTSALMTLCMILNAVANGVLNVLLVLNLPAERRGALSGALTTVVMLGTFASHLIYGFLGERIRLNLLGCAGFLLLAAEGLLFFHEDIQQLGDAKQNSDAIAEETD